MKQIVFYTDDSWTEEKDIVYHGWEETEAAIYRGENVNTTQMGLLHTRLFEMGYRIFVKDKDGYYKIKLGGDNERTNREIKIGHNLFKMWRAGEFSNYVEVINTGYTYAYYKSWSGLDGYKKNFVCSEIPVVGEKYKLINIDNHHDGNFRKIALIQNPRTAQVFIIGVEGIREWKSNEGM